MGMKWRRLQVKPHAELVRPQFNSEHLHDTAGSVIALAKAGRPGGQRAYVNPHRI